MVNNGIRFVLIASLGLVCGQFSSAGAIFTDLGPGSSFDTNSAHGALIGGEYSNTLGVTFTPTVTSAALSIDLAVMYVSGLNNFAVELDNTQQGVPGALLASFSSVEFPDSFGIVTLNLAVTPVLTAGTTYWVVIGEEGEVGSALWAANNQNAFGLNGINDANTPGWDIGANFPFPAFEVDGVLLGPSTPEPSMLALSAIGVAALLARRWCSGRRHGHSSA